MEIEDFVKLGIKESDVVSSIARFDSNIEDLRNLIKKAELIESLNRGNNYNLVCCLADLLEDTQLAIKAYRQVPDETKDPHDGFAYLYIYGLMQALILQHDALIKLIEVSGLEVDLLKEYPQLNEVRDYRVRIAGHPVTNIKGGETQLNFLVRGLMDHSSFTIEQVEGRKSNLERASIKALLYCQMTNCSKATERIIDAFSALR